MKLNIGCGPKYLDGFINIDGSNKLSNVDKVIDISNESLLSHFPKGKVDYILAHAIVEHFFHWEAIRLLKEFHVLLKRGGQAEILVPDSEVIIDSDLPIAQKLIWLYGGQDIPRRKMDKSRRKYPQFFCHKFGWTPKTLEKELLDIGFSSVSCKKSGSYCFIALARK